MSTGIVLAFRGVGCWTEEPRRLTVRERNQVSTGIVLAFRGVGCWTEARRFTHGQVAKGQVAKGQVRAKRTQRVAAYHRYNTRAKRTQPGVPVTKSKNP